MTRTYPIPAEDRAENLGPTTIEPSTRIAQARWVIERLERISADSYWAHQASGVRGALLRNLDRVEEYIQANDLAGRSQIEAQLEHLVRQGYALLESAASEYERRR